MLPSAGVALKTSRATHQHFGTFAQYSGILQGSCSQNQVLLSKRAARSAPHSHAMYFHDNFTYCTRISYSSAFNISLSSQKLNTVVLS